MRSNVRFSLTVRETFNAAHNARLCGTGNHGHDFTVELTAQIGTGDAPFVDLKPLQDRLHSVISEFSGRDLDDMRVPSELDQLCLYLRERVALFFTITSVSVTAHPFTARVEFPIR